MTTMQWESNVGHPVNDGARRACARWSSGRKRRDILTAPGGVSGLAAETRSLSDISSTVVDKEAGLHRQLSSRQVAMIAIGGAIGTGLFLGSSLAVRLAGPAVILTFILGAVIALLLMGALSEMSVAHPTAGSFGVHAEIYLGQWAGFVVRYTYWAVQAIAIGG